MTAAFSSVLAQLPCSSRKEGAEGGPVLSSLWARTLDEVCESPVGRHILPWAGRGRG